MITGLSIVTVWVLDRESAKKFYTEQLGFTLTNDIELESGMRWLTVRPPGSEDLSPPSAGSELLHPWAQFDLPGPGAPRLIEDVEVGRRDRRKGQNRAVDDARDDVDEVERGVGDEEQQRPGHWPEQERDRGDEDEQGGDAPPVPLDEPGAAPERATR